MTTTATAATELTQDSKTGYAATTAVNGGRLDMPVLFLTGAYDYVCECVDSALPRAMREYCSKLTERTVRSGHFMAQEKPVDVNNALVRWMACEVPSVWPEPPLEV